MYVTCTVNPAIDYFLEVENLQIGEINRLDNGRFSPGGKGIIVSRILNTLGAPTTATGFIGGFTGDYVISELQNVGIQTSFISVTTPTRINVTLISKEETTLNTAGPDIHDYDMDGLISFITQNITETDTFFLCGNKAKGMDAYDYVAIAKAVNQVGARLIVDSNTDLLTATLGEKPFLIKPNHEELGTILNLEISTDQECVEGAKALLALGAQNVLVSRGGDGAILVTQDEKAYKVNVAKVTPGRQTIGAGDTMLASFVYALDTLDDVKQALALASAAGGATVENEDLATREMIQTLLPQIVVEAL